MKLNVVIRPVEWWLYAFLYTTLAGTVISQAIAIFKAPSTACAIAHAGTVLWAGVTAFWAWHARRLLRRLRQQDTKYFDLLKAIRTITGP